MKIHTYKTSIPSPKRTNSLYIKLLFVLSTTFLIVLTGCKKLVVIDTPVNQLAATSVFSNDNTAIAAQMVVYSQFVSYPSAIDRTTGLASDELNTTASDLQSRQVYTNSVNAIVGTATNWAGIYNWIYEENSIIENVQNNAKISMKVRNQLLGEAQFMRAYLYFYLVNFFGDVPLVLTTDYSKSSLLPRVPKDQVYQQMVIDLKSAQGLLSNQYLDATDIATTSQRIRPTSWAADALLARVYLYTGKNYADAEAQASLVINNSALYNLPVDPNTVFTTTSTEAIWQLGPAGTAVATPEGALFILTTKPGTGSVGGSSTINPSLLNTFEANDERKTAWVGNITVSGTTYYFPNKYKYKAAPGSTYEYSTLLRLAEQYLIRAEARTQQNNLAGAIQDINVIRGRAGLTPLAGSLTKEQVLAAVAQERRIELFSEGHRWFDLQRTGTINVVMGNPGNATQAKGGTGWQPYQALYPIPQADITNDVNLTQTPGY